MPFIQCQDVVRNLGNILSFPEKLKITGLSFL